MPVEGQYKQESSVYQATPSSYIADQIKNLFVHQFPTKEIANQFIQANQNTISQAAIQIQKGIDSGIQAALSRPASSAEIVGITDQLIHIQRFPSLDSSSGQAVFNVEHFVQSAQNDIAGIVEQKMPMLKEIEQANSELSPYGATLPFNEALLTLRGQYPPEKFTEMVAQQKKNLLEGRISKEVSELPAREETAISELETALKGQQKRYFEEEAAPSIMSYLNTRGLLDTGSLATALARETGRGAQRIEDVTTPLRAQSRLGGLQRGFEQTLRGALESGRSLEDAINFTRQMTAATSGQQFQVGQSALQRQYGQDIFSQQQALEMAKLPKGPSALDYYLKYGLQPSIDIVSSIFKPKKAGG